MIVKTQETVNVTDISAVIKRANEIGRQPFSAVITSEGESRLVIRGTMRGLIQFEIWQWGPVENLVVGELVNEWEARPVSLDKLQAFNESVRGLFGENYTIGFEPALTTLPVFDDRQREWDLPV